MPALERATQGELGRRLDLARLAGNNNKRQSRKKNEPSWLNGRPSKLAMAATAAVAAASAFIYVLNENKKVQKLALRARPIIISAPLGA